MELLCKSLGSYPKINSILGQTNTKIFLQLQLITSVKGKINKLFHCRNCLTKLSASLKTACSSPSPKHKELVLLDEASCDAINRAAVVWPLDLALNGDGAPLRVKCLNNANKKLLCKGGKRKLMI